jgi:hypothetical protein
MAPRTTPAPPDAERLACPMRDRSLV